MQSAEKEKNKLKEKEAELEEVDKQVEEEETALKTIRNNAHSLTKEIGTRFSFLPACLSRIVVLRCNVLS